MAYPLLLTFALVFGGEVKESARPQKSGPDTLDPAEAARREALLLRAPRQITDEGESGEGYFSPDGKKILYQSIRGGHPFYQIYARDLETGKETLISTGAGRTTCAYFHPTQEKIIFASSHLDPQRDATVRAEWARLEELRRNPPKTRSYAWAFDPHMDIFECDYQGKNLRRLTDAPGYDAEGSYSPDGTRIVYCSCKNGAGDIYVMNADGSNVRQLTDSPGYDGGPFFSPDGKRIIFRGEVRKRHYLQLFVMNADGSDVRQLTENEAVNWGPYWHPQGRHVIFSTSLQGHYNYELYLLDVETKALERVTFTAGADVLPVFSPDGKKVLWTSKRGKDKNGKISSQLWIADWAFSGTNTR